MVHFIWIYLRVAEHEQWEMGKRPEQQTTVDIILPTGAMGNLGKRMSSRVDVCAA